MAAVRGGAMVRRGSVLLRGGAAKPEREIYLEATGRLGVEPAQSLFIGDGGDDELLGAERAGLRSAQAAWFRGEVANTPASIPSLKTWQAVLELVAVHCRG